MARLERRCVWDGMAGDVRSMTRLCLYCADTKAGVVVLRALEMTLGEIPTHLYFVFFYIGESAMDSGVDSAEEFQYVLVVLEDLSGCIWLTPFRACTASDTVEELVRCCATFGPPPTWVNDNAAHLRNRVMSKLAK